MQSEDRGIIVRVDSEDNLFLFLKHRTIIIIKNNNLDKQEQGHRQNKILIDKRKY